MMSKWCCSTELELLPIPEQEISDIWERRASGLIWSRRLSWHWWLALTLNHDACDLAHIRQAQVAEFGEALVVKAEAMTLPPKYQLPPGAAHWRTRRIFAA